MFVVLRFIMLAAMREEGGLGRRHGGARGLVRRTLRGRRYLAIVVISRRDWKSRNSVVRRRTERQQIQWG